MQERAPWLVAKDALSLRYDGPIPRCCQAPPAGVGGDSFAFWAAAQMRAGIARRRREIANVAVLDDARLRNAVASLCRVRRTAATQSVVPHSVP